MANFRGIGMTWRDLSDEMDGMRTVIAIMLFEGLFFLAATFYIVLVGKCPIDFLQDLRAKKSLAKIMSLSRPFRQSQSSNLISVPMETPDVTQEVNNCFQFFPQKNNLDGIYN